MRMRTITTDTAIYMNIGAMPHFPSMSPRAGQPWIKVGLAVPMAMAGAMAGLAQETQAGQGASISVHLRISQLATNVTYRPAADRRGADDRVRRSSVSTRYSRRCPPPTGRSGAGPLMKDPAGSASRCTSVSRSSGQRHLRKLVQVSTSNGTTRTSTDYFTAFNQPVHVTLPPASQTLNLFGF